jgi:predicted dehydrogenase
MSIKRRYNISMPKKPYEVLLIGAGNRGADVYATWILANPHLLNITAVAEPDPVRREAAARQHNILPEHCFTTWEEAFNCDKLADVAIIATQDQMHTEPTLSALAAGYDVLLEKPMAHRLPDCVALVEAAERHGKLLQIAHVLRYTNFFQRVQRILQSGELGQIITVSHRENVSSWHMAHSYVRGNWRRSAESSPMILAKSCHDLDILYWILNSRAKSIRSVGGLRHFIPENAPPAAPDRCLDGCPAAGTCPFYAPALYIDLEPIYLGLSKARSPGIRLAGEMMRRIPGMVRAAARVLPPLRQLTAYEGWPRSVITDKPADPDSLRAALETGPYGRCVYRCDNDVVDHQVVLMEMENGVSVSFSMHGHSHEEGRTLRIDGSQATLLGKFSWNRSYIEVHAHRGGRLRRIELPNSIEGGGHGGGDSGFMKAFVSALDGSPQESLTDARSALESHLMAFAAEEARLSGQVVKMAEFLSTID